MDTPNTQNNTSRMRESRKLEQKRKRQQQVRRQKIFLACSCLFLSDPDCRNRFIRHTLSQSSKGRRPGGRTPETDKTKAGSRVAKTAETGK